MALVRLFFAVRFHVFHEVTAHNETLLTHAAFVRFFGRVPFRVLREIAAVGKCHGADFALVRLFSHVPPHVNFEVPARGERFFAHATSMLLSFAGVYSHVRLEVRVARKSPMTNDARVLRLPSMPLYMPMEVAMTGECGWTEVTL